MARFLDLRLKQSSIPHSGSQRAGASLPGSPKVTSLRELYQGRVTRTLERAAFSQDSALVPISVIATELLNAAIESVSDHEMNSRSSAASAAQT